MEGTILDILLVIFLLGIVSACFYANFQDYREKRIQRAQEGRFEPLRPDGKKDKTGWGAKH